MAAGMARHEEHLRFGFAEAIAVAVIDLDIDAGNAGAILPRPDDGAACCLLDLQIAANMVAVMVRIQDMGDLPAALFRFRQDRRGHGGVDHANRPALRLAHQPHVIVAQDRNTNDV